MTAETKKVGPFTWRRDDDSDEECWQLMTPAKLRATFFCVKNYGGKPNGGTAFSGWRLVSGGPFTSAGGWTTREAAMRGVVPYLLKHYREDVKKRIAEAETMRKALLSWSKEIGA
jgi:hypothetical protein